MSLASALSAAGITPENYILPEHKIDVQRTADALATLLAKHIGKRTVPNHIPMSSLTAEQSGFLNVRADAFVTNEVVTSPSDFHKLAEELAEDVLGHIFDLPGDYYAFVEPSLLTKWKTDGAIGKSGNVIVRFAIWVHPTERKYCTCLEVLVASNA